MNDVRLDTIRTPFQLLESISHVRTMDSIPPSAILPNMSFRMAPHLLVIGWLAILICVWTSGDRVIDLVFEEPNVVTDTTAAAEEPDNAGEHLLMRSQRVSSAAPDAVLAALDLDVFSSAAALTDHTALGVASLQHPPPRHAPVSFSVPLRI